MNDFFMDSLAKEKSMLYGSRTHSLVGGSNVITHKFAKNVKNLDQFYSGVSGDMKRKLYGAGKLEKSA